MELPYQMSYFPAGQDYQSAIAAHPHLNYKGLYSIVAVTMPERKPTADQPLLPNDFKIMEGMNEVGLTFSLLAYPTASGDTKSTDLTKSVLSTSDLGSWALGLFETVAQVKAALSEQTVMMAKLALLGGVEAPFHYVLHDRTGASIVIEFEKGKQQVYDNPVGVMTNGPQFPWHLTNLGNYTFLSNVDQPSATFGSYTAHQPDSGIATASLPSSNTSVGRFIRATYYSQFAERAAEPDGAVQTLAHIMNNFDRPRGISLSPPNQEGGLDLKQFGDEKTDVSTEYTSWTSLSDLERTQFYIRSYQGLNYVHFDLNVLKTMTQPVILPLAKFDDLAGDQSKMLKAD
jgi:penicillin V acylase-like amidase (Ntn superfamily)